MKKYTSDEVIVLVEDYLKYKHDHIHDCAINDKDPRTFKLFAEWLKDKEQSELPVKDQLIWVKNLPDINWHQRHFAKMYNDIVFCYADGLNSIDHIKAFGDMDISLVTWDKYSITDPNGIQ